MKAPGSDDRVWSFLIRCYHEADEDQIQKKNRGKCYHLVDIIIKPLLKGIELQKLLLFRTPIIIL
jgi:hypothetical protein